jgi:hypothetical protein
MLLGKGSHLVRPVYKNMQKVQNQKKKLTTEVLLESFKNETLGVQIISSYTAILSLAIFQDISKDLIDRCINLKTELQPIPKPERNLSKLSDNQALTFIRTAFSDPTLIQGFNKVLNQLSSQNIEEDPTLWIGKDDCRTVSMLTSICLDHLGFKNNLVGVISMRPGDLSSNIGGDHLWVEVPLKKETVIIDLTVRQYTGKTQSNTDIETPHGAIAFKQDFNNWLGKHKKNWMPSIDVTHLIIKDKKKVTPLLYENTYTGMSRDLPNPLTDYSYPFLKSQKMYTALREFILDLNTLETPK